LAAGADCFSGTFTGIGERAGNAPIEEVCIGLKYLYNIDMDVRYDMITNICRLVEKYSGVHTQVHKPIIGANAFTHESGIHADGVIKKPETYENFDPEFVGQKRRFVFGKHSGRSVVRYVLGDVREEEIVKTLEEVKKIAERERKVLDEEDIINIYKRVRMWDETI
jgi:isopropylmalate/homocitrate/citramalate synthase